MESRQEIKRTPLISKLNWDLLLKLQIKFFRGHEHECFHHLFCWKNSFLQNKILHNNFYRVDVGGQN